MEAKRLAIFSSNSAIIGSRRINSIKSYISKVENGVIVPSVGAFYRIINALGMSVEVVKPIY